MLLKKRKHQQKSCEISAPNTFENRKYFGTLTKKITTTKKKNLMKCFCLEANFDVWKFSMIMCVSISSCWTQNFTFNSMCYWRFSHF